MVAGPERAVGRRSTRLPTRLTGLRVDEVDPLLTLQSVSDMLRAQPASARLDAALCLLEIAQQLMRLEPGSPKQIDEVQSCLRAAKWSVRCYLLGADGRGASPDGHAR